MQFLDSYGNEIEVGKPYVYSNAYGENVFCVVTEKKETLKYGRRGTPNTVQSTVKVVGVVDNEGNKDRPVCSVRNLQNYKKMMPVPMEFVLKSDLFKPIRHNIFK